MGLGMFGSSGKESLFRGCNRTDRAYVEIESILDDDSKSDAEKLAEVRRKLLS